MPLSHNDSVAREGEHLAGTAETAGLPAVYAAASGDAEAAVSTGRAVSGTWAGPPGPQRLYSRLGDAEQARRSETSRWS